MARLGAASLFSSVMVALKVVRSTHSWAVAQELSCLKNYRFESRNFRASGTLAGRQQYLLPKRDRPIRGSNQREENRTLVTSQHGCPDPLRMDMVELDFVAYIRKLLHRAKMSEEAFSVTLWACSAYAAVTPAVGISNRCCPPSVPRSHVWSDFISSPHFSFRA